MVSSLYHNRIQLSLFLVSDSTLVSLVGPDGWSSILCISLFIMDRDSTHFGFHLMLYLSEICEQALLERSLCNDRIQWSLVNLPHAPHEWSLVFIPALLCVLVTCFVFCIVLLDLCILPYFKGIVGNNRWGHSDLSQTREWENGSENWVRIEGLKAEVG